MPVDSRAISLLKRRIASLREARSFRACFGFDPDEARDEKGRWAQGGRKKPPKLTTEQQKANREARGKLVASWPEFPWPAGPVDGRDPKAAFEAFRRDVAGKRLVTPLGFTVQINDGHFFRLATETPSSGERKGHVKKASSAQDALAMLAKGELSPSDIAGYRPGSAAHLLVFPDLITDPYLILRQPGSARTAYHFLKRYEGMKGNALMAVTTDEGGRMLAVQSFGHRPIVPGWFAGKEEVYKKSAAKPQGPAAE